MCFHHNSAVNDFATLPVALLFDGEGNRMIQRLTRVPSPGEFIHIKAKTPAFMAGVLVVTHLAWDAERPEAVAEVHCVRVDERVADRERVKMAAEERSNNYGL